MRKLLILIFGIVLVTAKCAAQVNFTPNWGKRTLAQGSDPGCKAPLESLMYIYKLLQSEAQKMLDCERLSNM